MLYIVIGISVCVIVTIIAIYFSYSSGSSIGSGGRTSTMEKGTDRGGGDYKNFPLSNSTNCAEACVADKMCKSWAWGPYGANPNCFLKNTVPPLAKLPGYADSGVISG